MYETYQDHPKQAKGQHSCCACRRISRLCHRRGHLSYHPSGQQATGQGRRRALKPASYMILLPSKAADNLSPEEIAEKLNEKVAEGMINISMNTAPYFENGKAEGNVMIVNESINNYPQQVEFIRNDTQEIIYQSKAIPIGCEN